LLTVIGPGGIGKTRLALQAGTDHIGAFAHGVFFVSLAPLNSAELTVPAIAEALHFAFFDQQDPKVQLFNYLGEKEMLLILDNFEQIRDGAPLLTEVLRSAPQVTLLVTSRERLHLQSEWSFELQGLPFPRDGRVDDGVRYSAIELFTQSARHAHPGFSPSETEMRTIAQICQLVEGMPLALELAAIWVRVIPCHDIAHEIERSLSVLTTTWPDVPERHRSLWAVFEHSWQLMSDAEQTIFRKLAVFRGGFDRAAAEDVTGASLPLLAALVDKSLLRRSTEGRYSLHELVRQYADEKLEEADEREQVQNRHLDHFLKFAEAGALELDKSNQIAWLDRFEIEHNNLRAALDWSIQIDVGRASRLAYALSGYWLVRDYISEGRAAFARLLALSDISSYPSLKAKILIRAGTFAHWYDGDFATARSYYEESFAICHDLDDNRWVANALGGLGFIALNLNELPAARRYLEEALTIQRGLDDRPNLAETLSDLGSTEITADNYLAARSLCEESLAIFKELGDNWSVARGLRQLGTVALVLGDLRIARQYQEDSLAINRLIRSKAGVVESLSSLGEVYVNQGELMLAHSIGEECSAAARDLGDKYSVAWALDVQGQVAYLQGNTQLARSLLEERLNICQSLAQDEYIAWTRYQLGQVETCCSDTTKASLHFKEGLALFRNVGTKEGIAWSLLGLACIAVLEKDTLQASRLLEECLPTFQALGIMDGVAKTLRCQGDVALQRAARREALVLYRRGLNLHSKMGAKLDSAEDIERLANTTSASMQPVRATRLFGAAAALRETLGAPRASVDHIRYGSAIAEIRAHVDEASFKSAWAEGYAMTLDQAIDYALTADGAT
jgi:predicted ATPase